MNEITKKTSNGSKIAIAISVLIVLVLVIALIRAKRKEANLPSAKTYSVKVSTLKLKKGKVSLTLPYLAQTKNDMDVKLASKIAARVNYVKKSGSFVKRGQAVARLDATGIKANQKSVESQLTAAKTALKNLEATHKRTLELLDVKGASIEQSEMEESKIAGLEAKVESLTQSLKNVTNTLTYAIIKSPVSGMISKTMVNVGDMAMPGRPVAAISASRNYYLMLYVPSNIKVYSVFVQNKNYPAVLLNTTMRGLTAYRVNVKPSGMTTGERVEVNVEVFNGEGVKIPFDAILNRNNKSYVLVKENDKAKPVEINIIQTGEDGAVISNNELAGKEIVVAKQDILLTLLSGESIKTEEK